MEEAESQPQRQVSSGQQPDPDQVSAAEPVSPLWQPLETVNQPPPIPPESLPGGSIVTSPDGSILSADVGAVALLRASPRRLIGSPLSSFLTPEGRRAFEQWLDRVRRKDHILEWRSRLSFRDERTLPVLLSASPIFSQNGELAEIHWLVRDGTHLEQERLDWHKTSSDLAQEIEHRRQAERMQRAALAALQKTHASLEKHVRERTAELAVTNQKLEIELSERKRLEEAAAQRARELTALHAATATLLVTLDLETLLGKILDAANAAIPAAQKGMLHLIARDTGELEMRAFLGYSDARIRKISYLNSKGYIASTVRSRTPLLVHDVQNDPAFRYDGQIPEVFAIRSVIVAPLLYEEQALGALSLESTEPSAFSERDLWLLSSFAATATAAINNAQLHAEVQKLAITDVLTGLYNRRGFNDLARREMERARRFGRPVSAIMLDIDHFKEFNDTHGHAAGDLVIKEVGERLLRNVREIDILGRYGGDEFLLLLAEIDLGAALLLAERLRACVANLPIYVDGQMLSVTVSMGVASTEDDYELTTLTRRADSALYVAKQKGRDCVEFID